MKAFIFAAALLLPAAAVAQGDSETTPDLKTAKAACDTAIGKLPGSGKVRELAGVVPQIGGYYAVLINGDEDSAQRWLCLYDVKTKKAQAGGVNEP
ncbi:MAG TPA: hypothetical protein VHW02_08265 [Rhizomicrobium sp.]|jgi:hypothetical protein|nr:hypothetical protein [Rhizomicrobium sp.]